MEQSKVVTVGKSEIWLSSLVDKLQAWESGENSLAPLSSFQRNTCLDLREEVTERPLTVDFPDESIREETNDATIKTLPEFYKLYSAVSDKLDSENSKYEDYLSALRSTYEDWSSRSQEVGNALEMLLNIKLHCEELCEKTKPVNESGKELHLQQKKLKQLSADISSRIQPFEKIEAILRKLDTQFVPVYGDGFLTLLTEIDECVQYFSEHDDYMESSTYVIRARRALSIALTHMKDYILMMLDTCKTTDPFSKSEFNLVPQDPSHTPKFVVHYSRFQAIAQKLKPLLSHIESKKDICMEYETTLLDCQRHYITLRRSLIQQSLNETILQLVTSQAGDHCSLLRSMATFLIYLSQDEDKLYYQFFTQPSPIFDEYMESVCAVMYDTMRPYIIHMKHLETLAEICSVLRVEILQDRVKSGGLALQAFGNIAEQLLQDVQERLVFRAHLYFKHEIAEYQPSAGDLAYPEMLEMMKNIAEEIRSQESTALSRSESRLSLSSITSVADSVRTSASRYTRHPINSSSSDLQGMWYPSVRRTLVCLSRLYRCIEKSIFQGLAQEAIACCTENVARASHILSTKKSLVDGYLFQIRHLLILREQVAPFQVDFTVKETTLDLGNLKTAAYSLLQKHDRLLSFSSNNALLEFILQGPPLLREEYLDSRKIVDQQLKTSCEQFIDHVTRTAVSSIQDYLKKVQNHISASENNPQLSKEALPQQQWGHPENVRNIVQETVRKLKTYISNLQNTMGLYLANADTQFILFRPIKNNIVSAFTKLRAVLTERYSKDDQLLIACPAPEQVSIIISSTSLSSRKSSLAERSVPVSGTT